MRYWGMAGIGGVLTGGGGTSDVVMTMPGDVGDDCRRRVTPSFSSLGFVVKRKVSRGLSAPLLPLLLPPLMGGFSGSMMRK
jgi:hypothetical protein